MFAALLPLLEPLIGRIIDLIPDPAAREKAKAEAMAALMTQLLQADATQAATNTEEAKNQSVFVAGWRPFIGWVCGVALAYQFVLLPLGMFVSFAVGHPIPKPPALDDTLWQLMFGMLGMGALRSFDKAKSSSK